MTANDKDTIHVNSDDDSGSGSKKTVGTDGTPKIQNGLDKAKKSIAGLEAKTKKQASWNFGDDDVKQWKHDVLLELVGATRVTKER